MSLKNEMGNKDMKEEVQTLIDIIVGIVLVSALIAGISLAVTGGDYRFSLGVLLGAICAVGVLYHMYRGLNIALDMGAAGEKYTQRQSVMRMGIMSLVVVLAIFLNRYIHAAGVVIGLLTLKVSAYLQPVIHKYITTKFYNKGR